MKELVMLSKSDAADQNRSAPTFVQVQRSLVRIVTRESVGDTGPPILLINGLGARLEMWKAFTAVLPARRLLMFDLPGITGASATNFPLGMPGLAHWLTHLMDGNGIQDADVIGYSWGGALAQQLARDAPARIRALILVSTNFGYGALPSLQPLPMPGFNATDVGDKPWDLFSAAIGGATASRNPIRAMMNAVNPTTTPLEGYWRQLIASTGWTSLPWLHKLDAQTLVIAGDNDPYIATSTTRLLASSIPHAQLEFIQGGGHLLPMNHPAKTAGTVAHFLSRLDQ